LFFSELSRRSIHDRFFFIEHTFAQDHYAHFRPSGTKLPDNFIYRNAIYSRCPELNCLLPGFKPLLPDGDKDAKAQPLRAEKIRLQMSLLTNAVYNAAYYVSKPGYFARLPYE
jgi:hypothetical protein